MMPSAEVLTVLALAFGGLGALLLIHALQYRNPPPKTPPSMAE